jgi:hypothetical protein
MENKQFNWCTYEDNKGERRGISVNAKTREEAIEYIIAKHPSSHDLIHFVRTNQPYVSQEGDVDVYVRGAVLV